MNNKINISFIFVIRAFTSYFCNDFSVTWFFTICRCSASTSIRSVAFNSSGASSSNRSRSSVMVSSRSAVIFLEGLSSSLIACSTDFSEIPLFQKQFFMVNSDTSDQADCNSCMASNIDVSGSFFFMSTARISTFMIFLRYFAFRECITP